MQNGPEGPSCAVYCVEALCPGLTLLVDRHGGSGRCGHLHAMLLAAEGVGDIPIVGMGLAGHIFATLDVPGLYRLSIAAATDIGAHRGPRYSPAGSGDILTPSASDLVTQNAADDGAGNRSGNIDAASFLGDFFAFDPASLFGRADHRAY